LTTLVAIHRSLTTLVANGAQALTTLVTSITLAFTTLVASSTHTYQRSIIGDLGVDASTILTVINDDRGSEEICESLPAR
jgi:hypothetical protein